MRNFFFGMFTMFVILASSLYYDKRFVMIKQDEVTNICYVEYNKQFYTLVPIENIVKNDK